MWKATGDRNATRLRAKRAPEYPRWRETTGLARVLAISLLLYSRKASKIIRRILGSRWGFGGYANFNRLATGLAAAGLCATRTFAGTDGSAMLEGGYELPPFSFVQFCLDYPAECPAVSRPARVNLTDRLFRELIEVNKAVNAAIRPQANTSVPNHWKLNATTGDCNTFAAQKRHELLVRGWPSASLALSIVRLGSGQGHMLLTIRTDRGDLVLDNLQPSVLGWQQTSYHWIMRQSVQNPRFWVALQSERADSTGALRQSGYSRRASPSADPHTGHHWSFGPAIMARAFW